MTAAIGRIQVLQLFLQPEFSTEKEWHSSCYSVRAWYGWWLPDRWEPWGLLAGAAAVLHLGPITPARSRAAGYSPSPGTENLVVTGMDWGQDGTSVWGPAGLRGAGDWPWCHVVGAGVMTLEDDMAGWVRPWGSWAGPVSPVSAIRALTDS